MKTFTVTMSRINPEVARVDILAADADEAERRVQFMLEGNYVPEKEWKPAKNDPQMRQYIVSPPRVVRVEEKK